MAYSQEELDHQYSPSKWALRANVIESHCSILATESERSRQELQVQTETYGSAEEQLQIALPTGADRNVAVVYFHGGMWQALRMSDSLFLARPLAGHGVTTVAVEYTLAPTATMTTIVDQCVRAVRHVHARLPAHRLYLLGHSAGGHLAAMVLVRLATDPLLASIAGVCPVSGLFDLAPVQRCYANEALQITAEEIASLSPARHVPALAATRVPILLAVAEKDTTLFRDETLSLHRALQAAGAVVDLVDYPGLDHFTIIEKLHESDYDLVHRVLVALDGGARAVATATTHHAHECK